MPIEYTYNEKRKIILAKGVDVVTLEDLLEYGKEVISLNMNLQGAVEYVDFSEIKDISVTYQSAKKMLSMYSEWVKLGVRGSILYAPTTISFGMARMIGSVLSSVMNVDGGGPEIVREPLSDDEIIDYFKIKGS